MAVPTPVTRSITSTLKQGSSTLDTGGGPSVTADNASDLIQAVVASTANQHFVFSIKKDKLKQSFIVCDVDATVYTNDLSSGSPDDTIPLSAGKDQHYEAGSTDVNPVSNADVTDIYVTVAGGTGGTLRWFTLQDPTP